MFCDMTGAKLRSEMRKHCYVLAAGLLLTATPVPAHHAFAAEYDSNKVVTVTGAVTGFTWSNPHAWLYLTGKDDSGRLAAWSFEMGSPNGLVHRGWIRTDLRPGDRITVDGYRAKGGTNTANARTVTLPGGKKLFGGFQSTPGAPPR